MIDSTAIAEKLKTFVTKKSRLIKSADLRMDTPLFSSGLLDSLAFVQLVAFIQSDFRVKLSATMSPTVKNLDTLDQITQAVLKAQGSN